MKARNPMDKMVEMVERLKETSYETRVQAGKTARAIAKSNGQLRKALIGTDGQNEQTKEYA